MKTLNDKNFLNNLKEAKEEETRNIKQKEEKCIKEKSLTENLK